MIFFAFQIYIVDVARLAADIYVEIHFKIGDDIRFNAVKMFIVIFERAST